MKKLLIFGGTAEGRRLCEYLQDRKIRHTVCVATEYGEEVLGQSEYTQILCGRLDVQEMEALIRDGGYGIVVDATHPYAAVVSGNVRAACRNAAVPYLRYLRPGSSADAPQQGGKESTNQGGRNAAEQGGMNAANQGNLDAPQSGSVDAAKQNGDAATQRCVYVNSTAEAADYLEKRTGKIFLTTGSKELPLFVERISDTNRLFARVLPSAEVIASCRSLGLEGKQLCAMQGPFSEEINTAMLHQTGASFLVTKDTGAAGGFPEKERAAERAGVCMVIIRRPEDAGMDWEALMTQLGKLLEADGEPETDSEREISETENRGTASGSTEAESPDTMCALSDAGNKEMVNASSRAESRDAVYTLSNRGVKDVAGKLTSGGPCSDTGRVLCCIGIGMGGPGTMTVAARDAIRSADIIFGAGRMLETAREALLTEDEQRLAVSKTVEGVRLPDAPAISDAPIPASPVFVEEYRAAQIRNYLDANPQYCSAAVLMSGDIGFYSGAEGIRSAFADWEVRYYCGISSIVYFASKIPTAWQDAVLLSAHGRRANLVGYAKRCPKVIALSGSAKEIRELCHDLIEYGLADVKVTVGLNLSYPEEQVVTGRPEQFLDWDTQGLPIVMIRNERAQEALTPGIADDAFVRGKVPMTKEEIRTLSVAKLRLTKDAIVYDVGAGTGSVSVECASLCIDGKVFAIEKNPEGAELIRENSRRFGTANLELVEGTAPEALEPLPAPTHAFIGGSSGNLRQIVGLLLQKNPDVRIVINTIALESISETMHVLKEFGIQDADIVQVSAAKSRTLGRYHMMQALNPIYIISFGGRGGVI